jgi:hypothetical protein
MEEAMLEINLNQLAFLVAEATVLAIALTLTARSLWQRRVCLGVALFCFVGTFLPMSRSGVIIAIVGSMIVALKHRSRSAKSISVFVGCALVVFLFVPEVVFSRLLGLTQGPGRRQVFTATVSNMPKYIILGVGAGEFWESWGEKNGFVNSYKGVIGAHSVPTQLAIYWGFPALICLVGIVFQAYRCLPGRYGDDWLALGVLGIAVALSIYTLFSHSFYDKYYSLGLGLLVGGYRWIWRSDVGRHGMYVKMNCPRIKPAPNLG